MTCIVWSPSFSLVFLLLSVLASSRQAAGALPLISDESYLATLALHENDEQSLQQADSVQLDIYTSHAYLAETNSTIYVIFVGDFATSGPHSLGSFPSRGSHRQLTMALSRRIGNLQGIYLENKNYIHGGVTIVDGWLLRYLVCQLQPPNAYTNVNTNSADAVMYEFTPSPLTWLSNLVDTVSNTYDVDHQQSDLPVTPLLYLPVNNALTMYSFTGN
jgi:hypothetical protein